MLGSGYCVMVSGLFYFLSFRSCASLSGYYTKDELYFPFFVDIKLVFRGE